MIAPLAPDMSAPDLSDDTFDAVVDRLVSYYAWLALVEAGRQQRDTERAIALARAVIAEAGA